MIYCWDGFEEFGPNGKKWDMPVLVRMSGDVCNGVEPMPPQFLNCRAFDEQTGEEVPDVLAYDDDRGLVDRLVSGPDGKAMVNASRRSVAVATEFRRLRFEPCSPPGQDVPTMVVTADVEASVVSPPAESKQEGGQ
jgi:hypothetical protein